MSQQFVIDGRGVARQFALSIGSVPLCLRFLSSDLESPLKNRYGAFADATPDARAIVMDSFLTHSSSGTADFEYAFEGSLLRAIPGNIRFEGIRTEYCVDAMLRIYLSWALLSLDGFLLHAASVVRDGRAYVFTGRSGAGKSTLASLAPEGSVLTDEISLLRKVDGEWRAYGTPFWGEFRAAGQNTSAPVAGIFRLLQSPSNAITTISSKELLRALLPNVLFFSSDQGHNARLLEILTAAVREIQGYNFEFRKDPTLWEVLPQ